MIEEKEYEGDSLYQEAISQLHWAMDEGYPGEKTKAIDDLISVRLAIMIEQMADRVEALSKAKP